MSPTASVIVPSVTRPQGVARLLDSLALQDTEHEVIVIDNGSVDRSVAAACEGRDGVSCIAPGTNLGYSRAINLGTERASGDAIVLLNDDCTVEPGFVGAITAALDPAAGITMSAGVMLEAADPNTIDSAGMELDRTLLVFDYLNGEPRSVLDPAPADPIGPSAAAAAFDRETFVGLGGFDEAIFAYWEDVDLILRMLAEGAACRLAPTAIGLHEHSGTLGSGSKRKNWLMGFGRGYVLRKWGLLPRSAGSVVLRDLPLVVGQALLDRNGAGLRGRFAGVRAASSAPRLGPPDLDSLARAPGPGADLARRLRRRRRLGRRA